MKFAEFKKEMKKYGKFYEYAGFMQSAKGYKERHYQETTADGQTTIGEPITADRFEDIVNYYEEC
ncbi:MAG: hypothetical protein IJ740_03290 [Ruminococcus sp.]|nr:hypothetical protein [Ruminococcus sp.]